MPEITAEPPARVSDQAPSVWKKVVEMIRKMDPEVAAEAERVQPLNSIDSLNSAWAELVDTKRQSDESFASREWEHEQQVRPAKQSNDEAPQDERNRIWKRLVHAYQEKNEVVTALEVNAWEQTKDQVIANLRHWSKQGSTEAVEGQLKIAAMLLNGLNETTEALVKQIRIRQVLLSVCAFDLESDFPSVVKLKLGESGLNCWENE